MTKSTYQTGQGDQSLNALPKRKAGSKLTSGHLLMILSGLATFLLIVTLLGSRGNSVTVFVAKSQIPVGQEISITDFVPTQIPSSSLDNQYFEADDFNSENKIYAARTIERGEPLYIKSQNTKSTSSNTRLISLAVSKKFAVNGALAKGDRIDIIETPEGGCSFRAMKGLTIAAVNGGTSSGGITGGESAFTLIMEIKNDKDDLILAGIVARGQFQIVRTTGVEERSSGEIEDTQCGYPPEDTDTADKGN